VRRLHHVEGMSKSAIAAKLSMSRNTVARLIELKEPPTYERARAGSQVDRFADQIAAMLAEDPKVPATVITERLRRFGYAGSVTIVKDHVRVVRPSFAAAQSFQRTSYLPGELAQTDWWHTGVHVPVGRSQTREAFGLVTGLPFSAAFRVVFAFQRIPRRSCRVCSVDCTGWGACRTGWCSTTTPASSLPAPVGWSGSSMKWPPPSASSV
jgi:transposase